MDENVKVCVKECIAEFKEGLGKVYYKVNDGRVKSLKLVAYNGTASDSFLAEISNYVAKKIYEKTYQIWIVSAMSVDVPNPEGFEYLA